MKSDPELTGPPAPTSRASGTPGTHAACADELWSQDAPDPGLALRVHTDTGRVVVELPDYPPFPEERTARELREQLYRLIDSRPDQLQLDLGRVRHASSFLMTTLVLLHRKVRGIGGRVDIQNADPHILHMIHICNLGVMLEARSDYV